MKHILALPGSLLATLLISATSVSAEWPYDLPPTQKYFPEHEALVKRDAAVQRQFEAGERPKVVRKMGSVDAGEKFFLGYWGFDEQEAFLGGEERVVGGGNGSMLLGAAVEPHYQEKGLFGRSMLGKREYKCPWNTTSCATLNSDLCCPQSSTCVAVKDGSIGCCPWGETCGDVVETCDTDAGYSSCPNSPNGGCCVPGAVCEGVGCVFYGYATTTTTLPVVTVTEKTLTTTIGYTKTIAVPPPAGVPSTTTVGYTTTIAVAPPSTTTPSIIPYTTTVPYTLTVVVTTDLDGSSTTMTQASTIVIVPADQTTRTTGTMTCTAGFNTCAASLGGGCCAEGLLCGTGDICIAPYTVTSVVAASAPIRPTTVTSATLPASLTTDDGICPTGYYMCSAYYLGGCCRVDRNCDTTSCPSVDSTTVLGTGQTVVVPASATADTVKAGTCANGWFLCDSDNGGGCCPSGYACGTSCTANIQGQPNTGKLPPSRASSVVLGWGVGVLGVLAGVGMMVL